MSKSISDTQSSEPTIIDFFLLFFYFVFIFKLKFPNSNEFIILIEIRLPLIQRIQKINLFFLKNFQIKNLQFNNYVKTSDLKITSFIKSDEPWL